MLSSLGAREAALVHLYVAFGTNELLEHAADFPLRTAVAPDLPAGGALPEPRPQEAANLPPAPCAKAAYHRITPRLENWPAYGAPRWSPPSAPRRPSRASQELRLVRHPTT